MDNYRNYDFGFTLECIRPYTLKELQLRCQNYKRLDKVHRTHPYSVLGHDTRCELYLNGNEHYCVTDY